MTDFVARVLGRPETTGRVVALDVARGLAILGMFTAHMWVPVQGHPNVVASLAHGRSAPLFALLAGVSLGIISDGIHRRYPRPSQSRLVLIQKILVRSAFLIVVAVLLSLINSRILLILDNYAVWFLVSLLLMRFSPRALLGIIAGLLSLGIPMWHWLQTLPLPFETRIILGLNDYYLPTYLIYVLTGLLAWRLGWAGKTSRAVYLQKRGVVFGFAIALGGYGLGTLLDSWRLGRPSGAVFGWETGPASPHAWANFLYETCVYIAPHTDSIAETAANTGWALGLTSLLLLAFSSRPNPVVNSLAVALAPLGAMALSAYSLHIVWHALTMRWFGFPALIPSFFLMVPVFLLAAIAWRYFFRRGPLESLLNLLATALTSPRN